MRMNIWTVMSVGMLAYGIAGCTGSSSSGNTGGSSTSSSAGGSSTTNSGGSSAGGESSKPVGGSSGGGEGGSSTSAGSSETPQGGNSGGRAGGSGGASLGGSTSKPGGAGGTSNAGGGGAKAGNIGGTTSNPGGSVAGNAGGQSSTGTGAQAGSTAGSTGTGSTDSEVITSAENAYWKSGTVTKVTSGTADITIDLNTKGQRWDGFGGTFNEMGWDALSALSATDIATAMKLLYDADDGARFVYGRIPLGASDYSTSWYTLDDLPSGTTTDYNMEKFSIARDKQKLIPFIKEAQKVKKDIHFWASPWVVPSWMMDGSSNMKNDAQTLGAHALYMTKFAEEYGKEGINIEAIHPQNEPGYGRVHWKQADLITFMKTYLGPKLAEKMPNTQVWCGTMSKADSGGYDMAIAVATAEDAEAMKYVKGFGLQWNLHDVVTTLQAKNVPVMQTEHRCGNYNFGAPYWDQSRYSTSKGQNDHLYGEESWQGIRDWIIAGVNSYCAWNMVLDTAGKSLDNWPQNALLVVDKTAKKLIITPAYYTFKHFSYFMAPGATRVGAATSSDAYKGAGTSKYGSDKVAYDLVNAFAFKNPDGSVVAQVYNKTTAAKKTIVDIGGGLYQIDVPAHGWATLRVPQ
jgi:glucosylceramidase